MAGHVQRTDVSRWKRFTSNQTQTSNKMVLTDVDINHWMKRVQMASDFAVSDALPLGRPKFYTGQQNHFVALHNMEQLHDHDEAYSEAQDLLSDWMNKKLRLELGMDENETGDSSERPKPTALQQPRPTLNYQTFNDMYSHLAEEDESHEVQNILQDLMETDLLDARTTENLRLDEGQRLQRDPRVTMDMRHKQVRENRLKMEAEREKRRKEEAVREEAREEAWRLEQQEQRRRQQEARRQKELLQQEVIRLRKEMVEKRSMELLARRIERKRLEQQRMNQLATTPKPDVSNQKHLHYKEQNVEARIHIRNLKCMKKHFSGWYSVVLERRVQLGKAAALCDWKRQLRAWRAWRVLVWAKRQQQDLERTKMELMLENRHCQIAAESNRKRLLRRYLSDWRLWCRMEKERRELLSQQEETRRKMADLISTAATGKLTVEKCVTTTVKALPYGQSQLTAVTLPYEPQPFTTQQGQVPVHRVTSVPARPPLTDRKDVACPTQAWQVTRGRVATLLSSANPSGQGPGANGAPRCRSAEATPGARFQHRFAVQQQTIAEQRRLLREQQEMISRLEEKQNFLELKQEAERVENLAKNSPCHNDGMGGGDVETRSKETQREDCATRVAPKAAAGRPTHPHPALRGMEERARQRAERRREVEELKRRREEEKLAQMKAAEEEKQRQEEEEKRKEAERRREERRQEKEREMKKKIRLEKFQTLSKLAADHYCKTLLLHRGLAPWKCLIDQSHANVKKAVDHQCGTLQRRCLLAWLQAAREALAEKQAHADQLYQWILLRRSVWSWRKWIQTQRLLEAKAEQFQRDQAQRRAFIVLLDRATHQRLANLQRTRRAEEHCARRMLHKCFAGWRRLPETMREERAREERRERLRRKVAEILPDFHTSTLDSIRSLAPSL